MERKLITCPETAHLEEIDYERTPLGLVIVGCSRFQPRCALECGCECARRMDRRDRARDDEHASDEPAFDEPAFDEPAFDEPAFDEEDTSTTAMPSPT